MKTPAATHQESVCVSVCLSVPLSPLNVNEFFFIYNFQTSPSLVIICWFFLTVYHNLMGCWARCFPKWGNPLLTWLGRGYTEQAHWKLLFISKELGQCFSKAAGLGVREMGVTLTHDAVDRQFPGYCTYVNSLELAPSSRGHTCPY